MFTKFPKVSISVEEGALYTKQSDFSCLFLRRLTRLTSFPRWPLVSTNVRLQEAVSSCLAANIQVIGIIFNILETLKYFKNLKKC